MRLTLLSSLFLLGLSSAAMAQSPTTSHAPLNPAGQATVQTSINGQPGSLNQLSETGQVQVIAPVPAQATPVAPAIPNLGANNTPAVAPHAPVDPAHPHAIHEPHANHGAPQPAPTLLPSESNLSTPSVLSGTE